MISRDIEYDKIVDPVTFRAKPLFWIVLKNGVLNSFFGPNVNKRYHSNNIQGDIVNGFPSGVWSYSEEPDGQITEQILFV